MNILKRIKKLIEGPQPWKQLEKNFKPVFLCDECGLQTPALFTVNDSELNCVECRDAKKIRARLKQADEEWGDIN